MSTPFPFTAVVGQDDLRLALLLNAVSLDLHRGAGLGRRGRPPRPQQPTSFRDGPQGTAVNTPTTPTPQYVYEEAS